MPFSTRKSCVVYKSQLVSETIWKHARGRNYCCKIQLQSLYNPIKLNPSQLSSLNRIIVNLNFQGWMKLLNLYPVFNLTLKIQMSLLVLQVQVPRLTTNILILQMSLFSYKSLRKIIFKSLSISLENPAIAQFVAVSDQRWSKSLSDCVSDNVRWLLWQRTICFGS